MADCLDQRVKATIAGMPGERLSCTNFAWLDTLVSSIQQCRIDVQATLALRLHHRYRLIRVAHATRAYDLTAFYRHGLLPFEPKRFGVLARDFFLRSQFPELTPAMLDHALGITSIGGREGRVFFEVDEHVLTSYGGQYLHYGSDYLVSVATNLGRFRNYAQALKSRGQPTVFVCDVPIDKIDSKAIEQLAGLALGCMMRELIGGAAAEKTPDLRMSFAIPGKLSSEHIVGHYHPIDIPDPLVYLGNQG